MEPFWAVYGAGAATDCCNDGQLKKTQDRLDGGRTLLLDHDQHARFAPTIGMRLAGGVLQLHRDVIRRCVGTGRESTTRCLAATERQ